jgi:hypothetical protein
MLTFFESDRWLLQVWVFKRGEAAWHAGERAPRGKARAAKWVRQGAVGIPCYCRMNSKIETAGAPLVSAQNARA